jgi:hypothetical protein
VAGCALVANLGTSYTTADASGPEASVVDGRRDHMTPADAGTHDASDVDVASATDAPHDVAADTQPSAPPSIRQTKLSNADPFTSDTTLILPLAPDAGDLVIVFILDNDTASGDGIGYTPPADWTTLDSFVSKPSYYEGDAFVAWHIVDKGEMGTYSGFKPSTTTRNVQYVLNEYAGVDSSAPIAAHMLSAVLNPMTAATPGPLTPSVASCLPVLYGMNTTAVEPDGGGGPGFVTPAGYVRDDVTDPQLIVYYGPGTTLAPVDPTLTWTATGTVTHAGLILLAPTP